MGPRLCRAASKAPTNPVAPSASWWYMFCCVSAVILACLVSVWRAARRPAGACAADSKAATSSGVKVFLVMGHLGLPVHCPSACSRVSALKACPMEVKRLLGSGFRSSIVMGSVAGDMAATGEEGGDVNAGGEVSSVRSDDGGVLKDVVSSSSVSSI